MDGAGGGRATDRKPNFVASLEFVVMTVRWLRRPTPTAKDLDRIPRGAKFVLSYRNEIGV